MHGTMRCGLGAYRYVIISMPGIIKRKKIKMKNKHYVWNHQRFNDVINRNLEQGQFKYRRISSKLGFAMILAEQLDFLVSYSTIMKWTY